MKWIVVWSLALATAVSGAAPGRTPASAPAQRKLPLDTYPSAVVELFVKAMIADKRGDLGLALRHYGKANDLHPAANTHYNLADVHRRLESYRSAMEAYRKYLALAPDARDRAEVERLIESIAHSPGTVVIDGEDPDAVVFVDGKLIGPSPVVLQLPHGKHAADRIGPTTHQQRRFTTSGASYEHIAINVAIETPGNVVLSASASFGSGGSWIDKATGVKYTLPGRQQLAPGRHVTVPWGDRTCDKLVFEVPKGDGITFVFLDAGPPAKRGGCIPVTVRQQKVRVPS